MHEFIFEEITVYLVFLRCKSNKPIFVDVDSQWMNRRNSNINPEIELQIIDQQRIRYVMTDN